MLAVKKPYYSRLLNSFFTNYEQSITATIQLLDLLGADAPDDAVNDFILSHPDYPSLLSISDCLREWQIENVALKIEKENIEEYPLPMMIHTGKEFLVVTAITDQQIVYLNKHGEPVRAGRAEFLGKWNGVALFVEAAGAVGGKNDASLSKKENRKLFSVPLLAGFILLLVLTAIGFYLPAHTAAFNIGYSSLLLLKYAGTVACGLLLWYQVDKNNPALKKICGSKGHSSTNCNAILGSAQANLFKGLSWSEVGFFYFTGSSLALLLFPASITTIAWLNVLTLPYTLYSVIYQKFVAKKWCPLCIAVQAILVLEFIAAIGTGLLQNFLPATGGASGIFYLMVCFSLPALAWYFAKPFITTHQKNKHKGYEFERLKHDPRVFNTLLEQQKKLETTPDGLGIQLGNKDAKNTLIKVCNPYCGPCSKAHEELNELLQNENLKVQIIFTATNDPADPKTAPVKHLMAIAAQGNEKTTHKALDDWYLVKNKNYESFAGKYTMNGELKQQDKKIDSMDAWCKETGISFTPTIFVNGYQLPQIYGMEDLKYIFTD